MQIWLHMERAVELTATHFGPEEVLAHLHCLLLQHRAAALLCPQGSHELTTGAMVGAQVSMPSDETHLHTEDPQQVALLSKLQGRGVGATHKSGAAALRSAQACPVTEFVHLQILGTPQQSACDLLEHGTGHSEGNGACRDPHCSLLLS